MLNHISKVKSPRQMVSALEELHLLYKLMQETDLPLPIEKFVELYMGTRCCFIHPSFSLIGNEHLSIYVDIIRKIIPQDVATNLPHVHFLAVQIKEFRNLPSSPGIDQFLEWFNIKKVNKPRMSDPELPKSIVQSPFFRHQDIDYFVKVYSKVVSPFGADWFKSQIIAAEIDFARVTLEEDQKVKTLCDNIEEAAATKKRLDALYSYQSIESSQPLSQMSSIESSESKSDSGYDSMCLCPPLPSAQMIQVVPPSAQRWSIPSTEKPEFKYNVGAEIYCPTWTTLNQLNQPIQLSNPILPGGPSRPPVQPIRPAQPDQPARPARPAQQQSQSSVPNPMGPLTNPFHPKFGLVGLGQKSAAPK